MVIRLKDPLNKFTPSKCLDSNRRCRISSTKELIRIPYRLSHLSLSNSKPTLITGNSSSSSTNRLSQLLNSSNSLQ